MTRFAMQNARSPNDRYWMAVSHIATSLPMITVSAHAMTEDIHKALDIGFDSYMTQPVDIPTFLKTMDHYLKKASPAPGIGPLRIPYISGIRVMLES